MTRKQTIYEFLRKMKNQCGMEASYTTEEIANVVGAARANVSSDLNRLFEEELVEKIPGWPVRYRASSTVLTSIPSNHELQLRDADDVFSGYIGATGSMAMELEKAKAAILYPGNGLPMLIEGPTGVGKTTFARLIYEYAKKVHRIEESAQFVNFNCADYANNPELIMSQLFGAAKGSYTGAEEDRPGLVERADGGVLFLDEVHRLPDTAQEMLFQLIDFGHFSRLGESGAPRTAQLFLIMATTENRESVLLDTFSRRVPVNITLPSLDERSPVERMNLIRQLFGNEARTLKKSLHADVLVVKALMAYQCPGNIGQLENDIRVTCAHAYVNCLMNQTNSVEVNVSNLPMHVKEGLRRLRDIYSDINLIAGDIFCGPKGQESGDFSISAVEKQGKSIYQILEERRKMFASSPQDREFSEIAMLLDIESYFHTLDRKARSLKPGDSFQKIPRKVLVITHYAIEVLKEELSISVDQYAQIVLAQYIEDAIELSSAHNLTLPVNTDSLEEKYPAIYRAAKRIEAKIQEEYQITIPCSSGYFLGNMLIYLVGKQEQRGSLLVACYGMGTARKMAKVANGIIGQDYVSYLELNASDSDSQLQAQVMEALENCEGSDVLVLADPPELVERLRSIGDAALAPVYILGKLSTSMVIDAALMMTLHNNTARGTYHYLKGLEPGFNEVYTIHETNQSREKEKRVIVTACVSGAGAAVRLKKIIESSLDLPDDVEIITMDMPSVERLQQSIDQLSATRNLVCMVGIDVGIQAKCPYISVDEFALGKGIMRLSNILNTTYQVDEDIEDLDNPAKMEDADYEQIFLSGAYLDSYLFYLDGKKLVPYLLQFIKEIERTRGPLSVGKRIMLCIHVSSLIERYHFENAFTDEDIDAPEPAEDLVKALEPLANAYHTKISNAEYRMVEQLLSVNTA